MSVVGRNGLVSAFALAVIAISAADASAQTRAQGYGIVGPVFWTGFFGAGTTMHLAGGGEVIAWNGVGASGEAGFLDYGFVLSANGSFHFGADPDKKTRPFVTAGVTHVAFEESFTGWNIGAGIDHWNGRHVGMRFELRDHIRPDDRGTVQYWSVRAGIAVR